MAKQRIFVDKHGNLISLYSEKFGAIADQYGAKQIHRASDVEFNNNLQEWEVRIPSGGDVMFRHSSRDTALQYEKLYLEVDYAARLHASCPIHS